MERHLEVVRTARYWVLGEEVATPREVWIVLHGYRQLAGRFLNRFKPLADGTRRIVAPEALSRFYADLTPGRHGPGAQVGASWMTREDREHEIADHVRYLDRLADVLVPESAPPAGAPGPVLPRLVVLGFSQGVAAAARWTVLGRTRPARLILWGDFVPPDLDLAAAARAWRDTEVVLVRGRRDHVFADPKAGEAEAERLRAAGLEPRRVGYDGGHDTDPRVLAAVAAGS